MFRAMRLVQSVLLSLAVSFFIFSLGCRGLVPGATLQEATAAAPPTITFTASPNSISMGTKSTLTWKAQGAVSATLDGVGTVPIEGSRDVEPTATTTYKISVVGAGGNTE